MQKIIVFLFLSTYCIAQSLGISFGFSTSNSIFGDVFYLKDKSSFHFGYSSEINNATGKEVSEQKSNYGRTTNGRGNYFSSFDFGYGYNIYSNIRMNVEISFASRKYYTNYIDGRFTGGGYHMITEEKYELGIGGFVGYNINNFDLFIGYNSVRKVGLGLRYIFKMGY
ncbi:MAG: hypothetical protein C4539_20405 [Ignavibacteriales bacterium]|nr:MAG: hypothetical protein C4539_20405 [Ignavibacteriales bacterium]